jgi:rod shape-determining protein MreD
VLSLTESSFLRTAGVVLPLLALQVTALADIRPFDVAVDLMLLLAAASGLVAGPRRGVRTAFFIGIVFDLMLNTAFGMKALTYSIVAAIVAALPFETVLGARWRTAGVLALATGGGAALEVLLATLFGRQTSIGFGLILVAGVCALAGFVLGPTATRVVRWCAMCGDRPRM